MRKAMGLGALIAASAMLVGCGAADSAEQSATPGTESTNKNPGLFEPCDIPDEALVAAGLDPATEDPDFFGVQATGWEACAWRGSWYFITVLSTTHSFEEVKTNPNNVEVVEVDTVAGRDAVTYRDKSDVQREVCDVAFASSAGAVVVRSHKRGTKEAEDDLCALAVRTANTLDRELPQ